MGSLPGCGWHILLPETDLLAPPPSPPLVVVQLGGIRVYVLKELCTTSGLVLRATKVIAWSLGRAMSTLVVQERHLAVSGRHGDADKVRFLKGPVSQTGLFGDVVESMAQQFSAA